MAQECKVCTLTPRLRDMVERMRTVDISFRDIAEFVSEVHKTPLSHASVQRHEVGTDSSGPHFDRTKIMAEQVPALSAEDWRLQDLVKHKFQLYLKFHKDEIPNTVEMKTWFELIAKLSQADAEQERLKRVREMFVPKLPAPAEKDVIEVNGS